MNEQDYKTIKPGVYDDISFADYCKIEAVNNSSMRGWSKSPLHASVVNTIESTRSLSLGRLVHCGKLEPQNLLDNYAVMPAFENDPENTTGKGERSTSKATAYYKAKVEEFQTVNAGKEIVTKDDLQVMQDCLRSLSRSQRAREYLEGGRYELTVIWIDPETGLKCKARLDCLNESNHRITDLKTTMDAASFDRSVGAYEYDRQAAFYLDGANHAGLEVYEFAFVVVENSSPFDCRCAPLDPNAIDEGRAKYQRAMANRVRAMNGDLSGMGDPETWNMPDFYYTTEEALNWE